MLRLTKSPEQTVAFTEQDVSTAMAEVLEESEGAKEETEAREVDFPSEVLEIESSKVSSRSPEDSEELPETLASVEDSSYYIPGCGPGSTGLENRDSVSVTDSDIQMLMMTSQIEDVNESALVHRERVERRSEDKTQIPNVFRTNVFRTCSEFRPNGGGPNVVPTMLDAAD
tara:strand:+ start:226 stop:738 length:513 start_codon:yes stop_codon:yes gene_type:complete